jgi:hypothetical protein
MIDEQETEKENKISLRIWVKDVWERDNLKGLCPLTMSKDEMPNSEV